MPVLKTVIIREMLSEHWMAFDLGLEKRLQNVVVGHLLHGGQRAFPHIAELLKIVVLRTKSGEILEFRDSAVRLGNPALDLNLHAMKHMETKLWSILPPVVHPWICYQKR